MPNVGVTFLFLQQQQQHLTPESSMPRYVTPCIFVQMLQLLGGSRSLHLQNRIVSTLNTEAAGSSDDGVTFYQTSRQPESLIMVSLRV
jgi:hypothetical protein